MILLFFFFFCIGLIPTTHTGNCLDKPNLRTHWLSSDDDLASGLDLFLGFWRSPVDIWKMDNECPRLSLQPD